MEVVLRKYFWVVIPLVIGICALFAARAVGQLIVGAVPAAKPRRTASRLRTVPRPPIGGQNLTEVVNRNVFCAACEPIAMVSPASSSLADEAAGETDEAASGEPVKSSLEHQLVATLVSDEDRAYSYAALMEPSENKVAMYGIGSKLGEQATVTDILDRRVLLENEGRAEFIELALDGSARRPKEPMSEPAPRSRPRSRRNSELDKLNDEVQKGVRKLGANKWELQRSALNKVLSNTTLLARSARIVPSLKNGKPSGFKLYAIRPGSIYSLIGMQNGDTINAINGRPMTTPDKALEVYTKVRNASHLTISFSRRGKTKTHDYIIR